MLCLPDTGVAQATEVAERICAAIADTVVTRDGRSIQVTVSIGVAALLPGETIKQWLSRSDRALYQGQRDGRNRCAVAPADLRKDQTVPELLRPFIVN